MLAGDRQTSTAEVAISVRSVPFDVMLRYGVVPLDWQIAAAADHGVVAGASAFYEDAYKSFFGTTFPGDAVSKLFIQGTEPKETAKPPDQVNPDTILMNPTLP